MHRSAWRNCLENRDGSLIGVPKAAKRARRGPDLPLLATKAARSRGLRLFSKQFRKVNSPKFTAQAGALAYSLVVLVALLYPLLLVGDRALCFWIYERLMVRSIGGTKALLGLICLNPTYSPALEPTPQHHWKAAVGF